MAWTKVQLQGHLSQSSRETTARTATLIYVAVSDTATTPVAAETATDGVVTIPTIGSGPIAADTARKVRKVSAQPDPESPRKVFTVTVECSTSSGAGTIAGNPLDEPDRVVWDFTDGTEAYVVDRDPSGPKRVLNSAGDLFDPFIERETGSIRATVRRYIAANAYSPITAVAYKDAVNTDGIAVEGVSLAANQCKMKAYIAGDLQEINGVSCREATFYLDFRETWDDIVDDRGYYEINVLGQHAEIKKGVPPTKPDKPWPLVEGTAQAMPGDAPDELTFIPYNKLAFASFGFA